jgi:MFS family permease
MVLVLAFIPNTRDGGRNRFDIPGFLLTASSLIALLAGFQGLVQGRSWVWPLLAVAAGLGLGAVSVAHLRRTDSPLLELSSFKAQTFAVSTLDAGNLFRITISATPFLLPLMFQLAFGLSAWLAGLYVLAYFGGNLSMKTVTTPALRRFGFRTVLIANGVLAGASMIACAFLTPATSAVIVIAVLLMAGLTRSMQFTALATLTFADIEPHQRASSSTLSSMMQQVAAGVGVAIAAILINLSEAWRGGSHLALADFRFAFLVVGVVALAASTLFLRLAPDAGAEVSGHIRRAAVPA